MKFSLHKKIFLIIMLVENKIMFWYLDRLCKSENYNQHVKPLNQTKKLDNSSLNATNHYAYHLTGCVEQAIFIWLPCLFMWLILPFWLFMLKRKKYFYIKVSWLLISKSVIIYFCFFLKFNAVFSNTLNFNI